MTYKNKKELKQFFKSLAALFFIFNCLIAQSFFPAYTSCVDKVSVQDAYSILKAKNDVYFHKSVHHLNENDWVLASDNRPWGINEIVDLDLTQAPLPVNPVGTPTTPKALLISNNHIYLHSDLTNLGINDWILADFNAPWIPRTISNIGITHVGSATLTNIRGIVVSFKPLEL